MIFLSIDWNPKREIFVIPYLDIPIVWYGVIFAFGFAVSYYIFTYHLRNYLLNFPTFTEKMIRNEDWVLKQFVKPKNKRIKSAVNWISKEASFIKRFTPSKMVNSFNKAISSTFFEEMKDDFRKGKFSFLFKLPCVKEKEKAGARLVLDQMFSSGFFTIKQVVCKITDRFAVYIIVATVLGARLGHLIFYEPPSYYLKNPLIILQTWKGGLSSHGGAIAIIIAVFLFSKWVRRYSDHLDWIQLLDLIAIPTGFVAGCIRVGNFFNQEILGTVTSLPWAVSFGNPIDGSMPGVARHPVQLYEAFFYFSVFVLIFFLAKRTRIFLDRGKIIGLFLTLIFTFRFFAEYLKVEQSKFLQSDFLTMGQILSIPMVIIGFLFLFLGNHSRYNKILQ